MSKVMVYQTTTKKEHFLTVKRVNKTITVCSMSRAFMIDVTKRRRQMVGVM